MIIKFRDIEKINETNKRSLKLKEKNDIINNIFDYSYISWYNRI